MTKTSFTNTAFCFWRTPHFVSDRLTSFYTNQKDGCRFAWPGARRPVRAARLRRARQQACRTSSSPAALSAARARTKGEREGRRSSRASAWRGAARYGAVRCGALRFPFHSFPFHSIPFIHEHTWDRRMGFGRGLETILPAVWMSSPFGLPRLSRLLLMVCPISLLTLSLLTLLDSNFPGDPLWTLEFHPL